MPDPRSQTRRRGIAPRVMTFRIDGTDLVYDPAQPRGSAAAGRAVQLASAGVVRLAGDGAPVLGQLVAIEPDGVCSVQTGGVVELPGGASAPLTVGAKIVGALGPTGARGYIRAVNATVLAEVAVAAHTILDSSDATRVEVQLG